MIKELKDYTFDWDGKLLTVAGRWEESDFIKMDKVRMLSLCRFIIRVLAHLSVHKRHELARKV